MSRPTAIAGIDHVLVGVRDLEAARRAYRHLGFTLSPRGRHIGWGTANYCIMLPESYVELLGIVDPTRFCNNLDHFLETREGVLGVAYATDDAETAAHALAARGIAADPPSDLKRRLELPEGEAEPAFRLVHLPARSAPAVPAFLCQHLTPALVWQPAWLAHANGAQGIESVTAVVADPGEVALAYGALFGDARVGVDDAVVVADSGRGRIRLVAPADLERLYPGLPTPPRYAPPWIAGLRLAVADLAATARHLDGGGVAYLRDGDTLLRLAPDLACGVVLEFAQG